jgi:hypothetical protein
MCTAASKVTIKSVKPILASRRKASGSEVTSEVQTTAADQAAVKGKLNVDSINKALAAKGLPTASKDKDAAIAGLNALNRDNRDVIIAVVVVCLGGGALVIAIAVYYQYFAKRATTTSDRDMEGAQDAPVLAPVVAPAATLGMPAPMLFDPADFEVWSKRQVYVNPMNQPQIDQMPSIQPQFGKMPAYNM